MLSFECFLNANYMFTCMVFDVGPYKSGYILNNFNSVDLSNVDVITRLNVKVLCVNTRLVCHHHCICILCIYYLN